MDDENPGGHRLDQALVLEIEEIGEGTQPAAPTRWLGDRSDAWTDLLVGHEPWRALAATLPADRLQKLIRGLVLYSQVTRFSGGSVSPVIPLYWGFVERFPEREPELTAWIMDNRCNEYEPFNGRYARSLAEYRELLVLHERSREASLAAEEARRHVAATARAALATGKLFNAIRRGDVPAVAALLEAGANWKVVEAEHGDLEALARRTGKESLIALVTDATRATQA